MSCHQLWCLTFVYSLILMSFITGSLGRRSCPAGRPTVDICTQGTVTGSETLLVDFSPEAGISACNCNLTIDGALVDVTSVTTPQSECGPQLEVELGVDFLEVDCRPIKQSYNTSEIQEGIIWTTAEAFYNDVQPQDLCLELNVHGGASTLAISCYVERDWEPSTTETAPTSSAALTSSTQAVTLPPATSPPTTATAGSETVTLSQNLTADVITKDIPFPPDHIRDELLKLAKNDENPILFETDKILYNTTDSTLVDTTVVESTTSAPIDPGVMPSGTTPSDIQPPKHVMDKILELANATSNPVHIEFPRTIPLDNVTSVDIPTTTSPDTPTEDPGIPMVPPTDIMNQLLDIANTGTNKTIVFPELFVTETTDSTTSSSLTQQQTVVLDESSTVQPATTSTTPARQTTAVDTQTGTPGIPMVPPTDIMNQLLDIANNVTNETIVFPEFPLTETTDSKTEENTTVVIESSTIPSVETSTILQQTTSVDSPTQTPGIPVVPPTDIMNQLIQIANNGTNDTIVFPEFPLAETPDSTTSSSQTQEQTTVIGGISTVQAVETSTITAEITTVADETTTKQHLKTTTAFSIQPSTGFDLPPFEEVPIDSHDDLTSYPESSTPVLSQTTTTIPLKTAPRGDIEITTQTDTPSPVTTSGTTDTALTDDALVTTTLPGNNDVTGARNGTSPDDQHEAEDKLVVIIVGAIIGIIVIVAIVAIIRAFCKSRRKSANITMMEKGGLENGAGASTGIDNPLVQLQQEQEMVETNPNPDSNQSGSDQTNGKMEANFSEGASEMNGNGVSNSPQTGEDEVFQSSVNN